MDCADPHSRHVATLRAPTFQIDESWDSNAHPHVLHIAASKSMVIVQRIVRCVAVAPANSSRAAKLHLCSTALLRDSVLVTLLNKAMCDWCAKPREREDIWDSGRE